MTYVHSDDMTGMTLQHKNQRNSHISCYKCG